MSADFAAELQAKLEEMRLRFNNNAQAGEDATGSLFPLPMVLKHGLAVVATCGFLSFFTALALFIYLSFKLVVWQFAPPKPPKDGVPMGREPESPSRTDVNGFLVPDSHLCPQKENEWDTMAPVSSRSSQVSGGFGATKRSLMERARREPPNQFLILIYNLLFADIQQSIAFFLNVTWLSKNGIAVGNPICYAQGWFVSTGDLASSAFLTAIAIHTYMGVVRNYRLPTWAFYSWIAGLWIFTYGLAIIQVIITDNGRGVGGLYVRAGAWCWVNSAFQDLRLYLHYLWIFVALALTTIVYLAIFLKLRSRKQPPQSSHSSMSYGPESPASSTLSFRKQLPPLPAVTQVNNLARHPAFLIYPLIYVVCTTPLAAGRIASMAGNEPSLAYFCFAGAAIASNGFLDVILYASTRRAIVFSGVAPPSQDTGIETFAFMRTPPGRKFGNVVYVSGGVNKSEQKTWSSWTRKQVVGSLGRLRPTGTRSDVFGGSRSGSRAGSRNGDRSGSSLGHSSGSKGGLGLGSLGRSGSNSSQDSLKGFGWGKGEVMGMAIQCDTVTSVVIEEDEAVKDGASSIRSGSAAGHHGPTVPPATVAPGRKGSVASLQGRGRGGNDY